VLRHATSKHANLDGNLVAVSRSGEPGDLKRDLVVSVSATNCRTVCDFRLRKATRLKLAQWRTKWDPHPPGRYRNEGTVTYDERHHHKRQTDSDGLTNIESSIRRSFGCQQVIRPAVNGWQMAESAMSTDVPARYFPTSQRGGRVSRSNDAQVGVGGIIARIRRDFEDRRHHRWSATRC
jgi:hypothetical protein